MKKVLIFVSILLLFLNFTACNKQQKPERANVTQRIQYDVSIISPDPDYDWWVQNIEGSERENFVKNILNAVSDGKVKAYDFFSYKALASNDIKGIFRRTDTIALERPDPPHELIDTVLVHELSIKDISKIRFLEEWNMNGETLAFDKKVVGICPLVEAFTELGESKGYKPLFWVFLDQKYPSAFTLSK
jgi:hypothetical protein